MDWVIVWQRPGATHFTVRIPNAKNQKPGETEAEFQQRLQNDITAMGGTVMSVMSRAEMPDRHYRPAWDWDGSKLVVDETKARAIELRRLKWIRELLTQRIIAVQMRAEFAGDTARAQQVKAKATAIWAVDLDNEVRGKSVEQMKTHRPAVFQDDELGIDEIEDLVRGVQATDPV